MFVGFVLVLFSVFILSYILLEEETGFVPKYRSKKQFILEIFL